MSREIEVRINKTTSEVVIEAIGYQGQGCTTDIESILEKMNAVTTERSAKPEIQEVVRSVNIRR